jgi:hypothetical protein
MKLLLEARACNTLLHQEGLWCPNLKLVHPLKILERESEMTEEYQHLIPDYEVYRKRFEGKEKKV